MFVLPDPLKPSERLGTVDTCVVTDIDDWDAADQSVDLLQKQMGIIPAGGPPLKMDFSDEPTAGFIAEMQRFPYELTFIHMLYNLLVDGYNKVEPWIARPIRRENGSAIDNGSTTSDGFEINPECMYYEFARVCADYMRQSNRRMSNSMLAVAESESDLTYAEHAFILMNYYFVPLDELHHEYAYRDLYKRLFIEHEELAHAMPRVSGIAFWDPIVESPPQMRVLPVSPMIKPVSVPGMEWLSTMAEDIKGVKAMWDEVNH